MVLVPRPLRLVPHRDGGDRPRRPAARADVDVHRPGRGARGRDHPQRRDHERARRPGRGHRGLHPLQPGPGAARRDARGAGRRLQGRTGPAWRRPGAPRHAGGRQVPARLRHDVRAGAVPPHPGQAAGRAPVRAGLHRRLGHPAAAVPAAGAPDRVDHRQPAARRRPHAHRHVQGGAGLGAARHPAAGGAPARVARHHPGDAARPLVVGRTAAGAGRRADRGAQGGRRQADAARLPAGPGLFPTEHIPTRRAQARARYAAVLEEHGL